MAKIERIISGEKKRVKSVFPDGAAVCLKESAALIHLDGLMDESVYRSTAKIHNSISRSG